jgi:hypothetical protein
MHKIINNNIYNENINLNEKDKTFMERLNKKLEEGRITENDYLISKAALYNKSYLKSNSTQDCSRNLNTKNNNISIDSNNNTKEKSKGLVESEQDIVNNNINITTSNDSEITFILGYSEYQIIYEYLGAVDVEHEELEEDMLIFDKTWDCVFENPLFEEILIKNQLYEIENIVFNKLFEKEIIIRVII